MKKTGYDQFFKAAHAAQKPAAHAAQRPVHAAKRSAPPVAKKPSRPFPLTPVLTGAVLISMALGYLLKPDWVDRLLDRVDVHFMGELSAEEAVKPADSQAGTSAKTADTADPSKPASTDKSASGGSEDLSYIDKLRTRKEELDLREKDLNQLEEELQRQKVEVDARIHQLEQMRRDIASVLKERVESDETQVNKLVDLYSSMKPKQAADIIGSLQEDLAVEVLGKMKKKSAAEVMDLLPSDKARMLSEKLTGYTR